MNNCHPVQMLHLLLPLFQIHIDITERNLVIFYCDTISVVHDAPVSFEPGLIVIFFTGGNANNQCE